MDWISVKDKLPEETQTVWVYNKDTKFVALACLVYLDGWIWAISNGEIYAQDGEIISVCEYDDDYDITHWMPLPKLPN